MYEGDGVKEGSVISVVTQMKIELKVKASKAGTVSWVYKNNKQHEISEGVL